MMGRLLPAGLALAMAVAGPAAAQLIALDPAVQSPLLTITQERLVTGTKIGKAVQDRFEVASRALVAENREIEAALEAEERDLTTRRPTLPPAEFRTLAEAFDSKVEDIRTAQDAKSRALTRQRDDDRKRLFEAAVPVLAEMMKEMGAVAIVERGSLLLAFDRIDVTDAAITRLDVVFGDGTAVLGAPAPAAPAPAADEGIPSPVIPPQPAP